jgi:hypothetical protein
VKLQLLRLLAFAVLMGLYFVSPWLGVAALVIGMGYTVGHAFFVGSHATD